MAKGADTLGKLVRDKIPAIMAASGRTAEVQTLDHAAYLAALLDKLDEETGELRQVADTGAVIEEAADVFEVLISLVETRGRTLDDLLQSAAIKRAERGGFCDRLWLVRQGTTVMSSETEIFLSRRC